MRSSPVSGSILRGAGLGAEMTQIAVDDMQMLDDVARILAPTPEERPLEVRT
jgi:hypothetical protein